MTRNQEEAHGQEGEDTKREDQEEGPRKKLQPPEDRSGPDVRRLKTHQTTGRTVRPAIPHPSQNERMSDTLQRPDD